MNQDEEERTAEDVLRTIILLEEQISNDKRMIEENETIDEALYFFSAHTFTLLIKRIKYGFFKIGEFEKGFRLEKLVMANREPIQHTISAKSLKVLMNINLYHVSIEDTFMELLREYSEYIKPILNLINQTVE